MNKNDIATIRRGLSEYKDPAHDLISKMVTLFENATIANSKKCFDLGFINSQNVKQNDSISMRKDYNTFVRNYLKMLDIYGENAIMVTQNEFVDIVNKYNLFCGPFENYQGDIPNNQIHEIDIANQKLWLGRLVNLHPYKLYCLSAVEFNDRIGESNYEQIMRFPFYHEDLSDYGKAIIAERHGNIGNIRRYYYKDTRNLFIAAPKQLMGVSILLEHEHLRLQKQERIRLQEQEQIRRFRQQTQQRQRQWENQMTVTDPLICTWIPGNSVIIHTAWGVEANEKLLAMRKAINHFILDVIDKLNPFYANMYKLLK